MKPLTRKARSTTRHWRCLRKKADKKAFAEIVNRYQAMVCGIAFSILNDFETSEDVGQDAFLSAWRNIGCLREPERLRPWLAQPRATQPWAGSVGQGFTMTTLLKLSS
jgi:hypothetical protein